MPQNPFVGDISMVAFNFAPRGWAVCDGQLLAINQNQALFSILGTTYGGDGIQTFALPDLRGRVPTHFGQGPGLSNYTLGEDAGVEAVTLQTAQMPQHNHIVGCDSAAGTQTTPVGNLWANGNIAGTYASASNNTMPAADVPGQGGSQPHENRQPFLTINFIIALQGVFPTRN